MPTAPQMNNSLELSNNENKNEKIIKRNAKCKKKKKSSKNRIFSPKKYWIETNPNMFLRVSLHCMLQIRPLDKNISKIMSSLFFLQMPAKKNARSVLKISIFFCYLPILNRKIPSTLLEGMLTSTFNAYTMRNENKSNNSKTMVKNAHTNQSLRQKRRYVYLVILTIVRFVVNWARNIFC